MTGSSRPFASAALVLLLAAGCAVNPATGRRPFTGFLSPAGGAELGREQHPKVLKEFGGAYRDPALGAYVRHLGQSLARRSETKAQSFTFTILNSDIVNAFALPGGYVYVTRGLLALASSEAELAGVLAHEIGHVAARHTAERYSRAVLAKILVGIGGMGLGVGPLSNVLESGAAVYLRGFSRDQEFEADTLGVRYLVRAGYHAGAVAGFLGKLKAHGELEARLAGRARAHHSYDMLSTHPRTPARIRRAVQAAKLQRRAARTGRRATEAYFRKIDGLAMGGDRDNGFIKGHRFVHPRLRFSFTVPRGFYLLGGQDQVVARGPEGARILFDGVKPRREMTAARYLVEVWGRKLKLGQIERLTVNGLDGATGSTQLETSDGKMDLRLVAIRFDRGTIYRFLFVTPPRMTRRFSVGLRRTTFSFRKLSAEQAAASRPQRLRTRKARPGDTVESLAALAAYESFRLSRFRTLNGLGPAQRLVPGQWIKIVRE